MGYSGLFFGTLGFPGSLSDPKLLARSCSVLASSSLPLTRHLPPGLRDTVADCSIQKHYGPDKEARAHLVYHHNQMKVYESTMVRTLKGPCQQTAATLDTPHRSVLLPEVLSQITREQITSFQFYTINDGPANPRSSCNSPSNLPPDFPRIRAADLHSPSWCRQRAVGAWLLRHPGPKQVLGEQDLRRSFAGCPPR